MKAKDYINQAEIDRLKMEISIKTTSVDERFKEANKISLVKTNK